MKVRELQNKETSVVTRRKSKFINLESERLLMTFFGPNLETHNFIPELIEFL